MRKPKHQPVRLFVYVLLLKGERYYVGHSKNPAKRIREHFAGEGSAWTRLHRPVEVVRLFEVDATTWRAALEVETKLTLSLMRIFGWSNVRGGPYSACNIAEPACLRVLEIKSESDQ